MPDPNRHITTDIESGVLVIAVQETQLRDFELATKLEAEMIRAVEESQAQNVVLDLQKVIMLTSAALLSLMGLRAFVLDNSGQFVICNLSEVVAQALTVSQLIVEKRNVGAHFKLAGDRASAVSMLQAEG